MTRVIVVILLRATVCHQVSSRFKEGSRRRVRDTQEKNPRVFEAERSRGRLCPTQEQRTCTSSSLVALPPINRELRSSVCTMRNAGVTRAWVQLRATCKKEVLRLAWA